jgi:hypothetical protein
VKRLSRPRRTASNLSDSIHQQLNMYAVMASSARVGMLALSQPAEAKIVYSPAHKLIESGQQRRTTKSSGSPRTQTSTASLGLLAMGAPARSLWRREEFAGFPQ